MTRDQCGGYPFTGAPAAPAVTIGECFAAAIAAKDDATLTSLLAADVDFGAMTPSRFWTAESAAEVVNDVILGCWFDPDDHVGAIERIDTDRFADCERVGYRFRVTNPGGTFVVDQQAYFTVSAGRIRWLRIMCSGYRRAEHGVAASPDV
jgi:hypothetical protein